MNQRLVYPILSGHITLYNNITYLTAYRKPPQYSYSVNTQNQQEVGEAAEFVADILAHRKNENDEAFFGRLNELLKKHLNVTIEVETFRNNTMLIEVVDANGIKNMLPDVGAGIGQVLPIFIQAVLSGEKDSAAISIIEEPESNLNAYSQAELADLFITMAKLGKQSRFLLETHSETLLLRLHRRILEGTLSPDDIAIYVVERPKDSIKSIVKPVEITAQGIVDFPEDFFDADYIEARAISQLQHQTKPTNLTW
ncbi:MAG TPA: AAA family ATPase [Chitinophagales bacterium]|nr:AAA family ATPase [Chitinophagales bacterium]